MSTMIALNTVPTTPVEKHQLCIKSQQGNPYMKVTTSINPIRVKPVKANLSYVSLPKLYPYNPHAPLSSSIHQVPSSMLLGFLGQERELDGWGWEKRQGDKGSSFNEFAVMTARVMRNGEMGNVWWHMKVLLQIEGGGVVWLFSQWTEGMGEASIRLQISFRLGGLKMQHWKERK